MNADAFTVSEAAEALGYSPQTVRKLCRTRPGFAYRICDGGDWRINADAVLEIKNPQTETV
jgi:excisionase family DNA binding protein